MRNKRYIFITASLVLVMSCNTDDVIEPGTSDLCSSSIPIGDDYDLETPFYFSQEVIPADNPMKTASVTLGRFLFWDKKLSADNTISCGSCHSPEAAFSDNNPTSVGIDGLTGERNSMALVNLAYQNTFMWDGSADNLEDQAILPVINPIEMHETWANAVDKIDEDPLYDDLFIAAYGSNCVDSIRMTKSIAQFVRSMVSQNSRYDKWKKGEIPFLTDLEFEGLELWQLEGGDPDSVPGGQFGADCFHCHSIAGAQFRIEGFSNNGLDSIFSDLGHGAVSGFAVDNGKFKIPTLRNVEYSFPYMHDGRFETLEDVIEHYNSGGVASETIDPFMKFQFGGLDLSDQKKAALKAFLLTLSDPEFINNPQFTDPH